MSNIDPILRDALVRLVTALELLERPYCLIGALVPRLLMTTPPRLVTRDADVVIEAVSMEDFEGVKRQLRSHGFSETPVPHRLVDHSGTLVDVIPYSETLAHADELRLPGDTVLNVSGFAHLFERAVRVVIAPGVTASVAPAALYAMLKLAAYTDRRKAKDLAGFFHCARHYVDVEDSDRRYGVEHAGELVPFEFGGAYLLGFDGRPYQDAGLRAIVIEVLAKLDDVDSPEIDEAAREEGHILLETRERQAMHELVRWYRRGARL